jgi:hypothetical protein
MSLSSAAGWSVISIIEAKYGDKIPKNVNG